MRTWLVWGVILAGCAMGVSGWRAVAAPEPAAPRPEDVTFFESRVRPLLTRRCIACHSQKIAQGGLRLDTAEGLRKGGDGGPALVPGKPDSSRLLLAVQRTDPRLAMPPAGALPAAEVQTLREWVERGGYFPPTPGAGAARGALPLADGRRWWSIRPLAAVPPKPVRSPAGRWGKTRIDAYLLEAMTRQGLQPSPWADRGTLIRRVSLGLTGLPPTPEEVHEFVNDPRPDAYPRMVERLLASPHYGERWARHWLDLTRYCDVPEPWGQMDAQAWLYRDWVVEALNRDLPYPRFVTLQLAADQVPDASPRDLAALGFVGLSPSYWKELKLAPDVIKTVVAEEWEERIHTVSGSLLALTVACARCHDHKSDPISMRDYYGLAGVFASVRQVARPLLPPAEGEAVLQARARVKALEEEAAKLEGQPAGAGKAEAARKREEAAAIRRDTPHFNVPIAYAVDDASVHVLPDGPDRTKVEYRPGSAQNVAMHLRGNPSREGPVVPRRFLEVLSTGAPTEFRSGSGRRDLAEAIFRDSQPLAARVIVNRVWRHHFGRGLVETPSNFGVSGEKPSHPELLDDLAARFIAAGWSLKWLHREILLSAAYQQCSDRPSAAGLRTDPENRWLSRRGRQRLEVEAWRDTLLAASGLLDPRMGGEPEDLAAPTSKRRTLYGRVVRRDLNDLLRLYDFPDPTGHSAARFHTTTPLQQLYVLNSAFFGRLGGALAQRVRREAPDDLRAQVRRAYWLLYSRAPQPREEAAALAYLGDRPDDARWQEYAEVLLAGNEAMYVN